MRSDPTTTPVRSPGASAPEPERLSLLAELRVLDAGLRETRIDWRSELREGLRCAFGLRRTVRPAAARDAVEGTSRAAAGLARITGPRSPDATPLPAFVPAYAAPRISAAPASSAAR